MATLSNSDTYSNSLAHDRYDEEDIKYMDRISSHATRETTLNMFRRQTNIEQQDTATTTTTTSRISQQEKTDTLSLSPIASNVIPYHSSLNIPTLSSTLPSRASSMPTSSINQQKSRLRRSTTNFYNRCQQPASVIPRHQTILETEVDNYNKEETETYKDNIESSNTETLPHCSSSISSLDRRVSTTTIRTNETLRSCGTESTIPTTMSNILCEKPNEDIILSTDSPSSAEKVLVDQDKDILLFHQAIPRTTLEKGKWVKDRFFTPHSESEISKNDAQEATSWLTTLHQYIEHSQKEILTKEKELLELRNELKFLEKVQAEAQQKINVHHSKEGHNDEKMEKNHDKQVNNKERSKEKLFFSLRKQAVNCINNIASCYKIKKETQLYEKALLK
ncbi:hypothetical protein BDC45DRAFT_595536 [Circinella umbellata]|nr:hypothetical protein BDC45DRAFT_595536 [Circinella umbellata]